MAQPARTRLRIAGQLDEGNLASFNAENFGDLQFWLDANSLTGISDGDPLSTWTDRSTNGNDFTSSGANRPAYTLDKINGLPAIVFDKTGPEYMSLASFTQTMTYTWFIVAQRDTQDSSFERLLFSSGGETFFKNNTEFFVAYHGVSLELAASVPAYHIMTSVHSHERSIVRVDGTEGTGNLGNTEIINVTLFLSHDSASQLTGSIAEVISYNDKLSSSNLGRVEAYLSSKYNIALV